MVIERTVGKWGVDIGRTVGLISSVGRASEDLQVGGDGFESCTGKYFFLLSVVQHTLVDLKNTYQEYCSPNLANRMSFFLLI